MGEDFFGTDRPGRVNGSHSGFLMLFGWLSADARETPAVIASMAAALRVSADEQLTLWPVGMLGIGVLERPLDREDVSPEPARGADGSYLWMSGEAFEWPSRGGIRGAAESRTLAFRWRLLDAIVTDGPEAIADLDGEYQIALWNPQQRSLLLVNDRFAALPLYIGASARGTAFAGGVRGVLMGDGISAEPDMQAIREAVSFGGYRLGTRTSVRDVQMVPPATAVRISGDGVATRRYWTWAALRDGDATDARSLMEDTRSAWEAAIARRLDGARRPGLTLSGGLDSRAILAEASRQRPPVTALTYGVSHSDDVTIARRAARAAGARWELYPLYTDGWLERRTRRIHETDGLMDLVDLMHTESLEVMPSAFDVYLSGYIGDVVSGGTYVGIRTAEDLMASMPYYGGWLGIPYEQGLEHMRRLIADTPGPARFAAYEHKLHQAISRISAAARPFATVRRPFVDYRFFETCQRVPTAWRAKHRWREQWLASSYPGWFARIPNQQTGVPLQSSRLRWHVTRAARFGWRRLLKGARAAGLPVIVRDRSYHPDERYWSRPAERAMIEQTILRSGSISCDAFGRSRVQSTLRGFFERGAAPVQVVGAMYVFEYYHQTLADSLSAARQTLREHAC
jgi:asparagine synthetase B (glutamine-hydrolysing)